MDVAFNLTERVVFVLPPNVSHNDGFYEAIRSVKTIAGELGAEIHASAVDGDAEQYETLLERVEPDVSVVVSGSNGWADVYALLDELAADDFVAR